MKESKVVVAVGPRFFPTTNASAPGWGLGAAAPPSIGFAALGKFCISNKFHMPPLLEKSLNKLEVRCQFEDNWVA